MTYRDDLQAARMRRDALNRELQQLRSRTEEYQELVRQEQALAQELAQCARDLDQARARVELPLLQQVRVASPCKERWDGMAGDEHVRFCGRCEKNVYDLSALTASQAEALLRERGESMCVRFFRRSDGTILTSDCPVGSESKRFWRRVTKVAVASGLAAAGITMATATVTRTVPAAAPSCPRVIEITMATPRVTRKVGNRAPMPDKGGEYQLGEARPLEALSAEMQELDQRIADAEARLAETTGQKAAIQQALNSLHRRRRARLGNVAEPGDPQRKIEMSVACRKNPLDC